MKLPHYGRLLQINLVIQLLLYNFSVWKDLASGETVLAEDERLTSEQVHVLARVSSDDLPSPKRVKASILTCFLREWDIMESPLRTYVYGH